MLGGLSQRAETLSTTLRMLSSNPHYHECPEYLARGRSIYRDMALVFGAVVTRSVSHDNEHF
jgi:hypothetical protein